jgi:hypothetical protein
MYLTDWTSKNVFTANITGKLNPRRRVHIEKLTPAFYGTRTFNPVFTRARHWSLYWASRIQSTSSHPISLRSMLMLSSHLRPSLLSAFLQVFQPKFWTHFSPLSCALHAPPISYSLIWSLWNRKIPTCHVLKSLINCSLFHVTQQKSLGAAKTPMFCARVCYKLEE